MTPPELDAETKARIEAEEAYRAEVRAKQGVPVPSATSPKRRGAGCGTALLTGLGLLLVAGAIVQFASPSSSSSNSASTPTTTSDTTISNLSPSETTPASDSSSTDKTSESPSMAPESIEKAGSGKMNTDSFTLQGGNYAINAFAENDCVYYLKLVKTTEQDFEGKDLASFTEAGKQESNIYNIEPGDYYIAANTGPSPECAWEVNISR